MALLADFRVQFPEFEGVSDSLVSSLLGAALLEIDPRVWGPYGVGSLTKADQGQMYLAAHKLAISPWGQNARTFYVKEQGYSRSTYGQEYFLLMRGVSFGFRVT